MDALTGAGMAHEQTLSEADRRLLALWAVSCAGRVTSLIEADTDSIEVIQDALDRAWSFGSGRSTAAVEIRKRMLAVKAVALANPATPDAVEAERSWQLAELTEEQRRALRQLPDVGAGKSGPLGPGLLSRDILGETIIELQAAIRTEN